MVQEFWNDTAATRAKAEQISHDFRALKETEAKAPPAMKGRKK